MADTSGVPKAEELTNSKELLAAYLVRANVLKDLATVDQAKLKALQPQLIDFKGALVNGMPPPSAQPTPPPDVSKHKVCIIGAGVSGLYSAHMLDKVAPEMQYDILESSNRVGGRLYTHYFSKDKPGKLNHDYYDIGAMRFPQSPVMRRTFKLFDDLGLPRKPYQMTSAGQPTRFNDRTVFDYDPNKPAPPGQDDDPFHVGIKRGGTVPQDTLKNPGIILDDAYDYYREKIKRDPAIGFKYLIKHDKFCLRDYLSFVEDQDEETIHWLETLNSATGWFSQAFTENVLESLAFDYAPNIDWWCIEGGTSLLTEELLKELNKKPELEHQVVAVKYDEKAADHEKMVVKVRHGARVEERRYAAVINTTTLGALQKMDLTGIRLPYSSKTAIRSLHYDSSTKVGIKFSYPWWRDAKAVKKPIPQGGLGKTDMPIRVCVYPSYNWGDDKDKPAVLLASYTWSSDSERIASFVKQNSPEGEEDLKELMIYNLARLHSDNNDDFEALQNTIRSAWITHHAYDWSKDPHAAGAFALFSPGQFAQLYSTLVRPVCDSRFHIVGEAASAHHAWIVGALDSAVRALQLILTRFQQQPKATVLERLFGRTGECDYDSAHIQVALGMLDRSDIPNTIGKPIDLDAASAD